MLYISSSDEFRIFLNGFTLLDLAMRLMTMNRNLLPGLSIATIFVLGFVSYNTVVYAAAAPGTADPADIAFDAPTQLVPVAPAPFAQYNFGSKSISLYFGTDTQISDRPTVISITGFTVDATPTAKFTLIEADAQQNLFPITLNNPVTFNAVFVQDVIGADGPAVSYWDTITNDVSTLVNAGDTAATITIDSDGSTTDCLVAVGVVFEEGSSGQPEGYVADGVALRDLTSATIVIAGIPAFHTPVAAHLYWNVLNPSNPGNQISINGVIVTADQAATDTPDPCWDQEITWGFEKNVTSEIVGNGNGNYVIDNLPAGLMEGASLVVIHELDVIDVEKTWTFTDYNWDPICIAIDILTGECVATRPANINNPADDVLADALAQDGAGKHVVFAQVHKDRFSNTNPGAFYALTTVDIKNDLSSLTVWENYEDCFAEQGLIKFVSKKPTRNVKVAVADPNGDITELTDDIYDGIGGAITSIDDVSAHIEITDASNLTEGSTVYVLVKFQDDLKNEPAPGNEFDAMCINAELVDAEIADEVDSDHAVAALRITNLP